MSFDPQPTLTGEHLVVRPLVADDLDAQYAAASDPLVWEQHPARNRHERQVFEEFFAANLASGGALAVCTHDGRVIGGSRYADWGAPDSTGQGTSVEIGWTFLCRDHWGDGTNRELKQLMIDHALGSIDTVRFRIGEHNMRSRRAVEKLGGRLVGDAPDHHVVYELTRSDWQA